MAVTGTCLRFIDYPQLILNIHHMEPFVLSGHVNLTFKELWNPVPVNRPQRDAIIITHILVHGEQKEVTANRE